MEFMGSMFLQLVYLYFTQNKAAPKGASGFSVGVMFGMCIMSSQHFTGGAINPSRAIGPLIMSFKFKELAIYTVSTWGGSICGYFVYKYLLIDLNEEMEELIESKGDLDEKNHNEAGSSDEEELEIQRALKEHQDDDYKDAGIKKVIAPNTKQPIFKEDEDFDIKDDQM